MCAFIFDLSSEIDQSAAAAVVQRKSEQSVEFIIVEFFTIHSHHSHTEMSKRVQIFFWIIPTAFPRRIFMIEYFIVGYMQNEMQITAAGMRERYKQF